MGMAMFKRTFTRTIPDNLNLRSPHMKMWGFEAKRARKFSPTSHRTLPWNFIFMLSAPLTHLVLQVAITMPACSPRRRSFSACCWFLASVSSRLIAWLARSLCNCYPTSMGACKNALLVAKVGPHPPTPPPEFTKLRFLCIFLLESTCIGRFLMGLV